MENLNNHYLELYYEYLLIERNLSPNTIAGYMRDLNQFFALSGVDVKEIDSKVISNYVRYLQDSFEAKSVQRKLSALRGFNRYLLGQEIITRDWFRDFTRLKTVKKLPKFLTPQQINHLLNSIPNETSLDRRNKAMLELIYASGMRVSELVNLEIKDINFSELFVKVCGKGNKERIVPINEVAVKYLKVYLEKDRIQLLKTSTDIVFLNKNGQPLSRVGFYKILKKLANNVGISDISPHQFRHSIATHMLSCGVNLKVIQEMLGHKNIATTEIYTHINQEKLVSEYNKYHLFGEVPENKK